VRIHRRKHQWLGPVGAVFGGAQRNRRDILQFAGRPAVLRDFGASSAVNDVMIQWIGGDVSVLDHSHRVPVAEIDGAVVAPAGDADRTALLLSGTDAIRKRIVGDGVVELRRGLVVPGTPSRSAVDGDEGALVADEKDNVAVVGINPEVLIIIAAGSAAETGPGLATITRTHRDRAGHVNQIGIFRIDSRDWQVATANAARRPGIVRDL